MLQVLLSTHSNMSFMLLRHISWNQAYHISLKLIKNILSKGNVNDLLL